MILSSSLHQEADHMSTYVVPTCVAQKKKSLCMTLKTLMCEV